MDDTEGQKPRVKDYMTREVATVSPDELVADVARRIAENEGHSGFPVCNGRYVQGIITARDLLLADDDDPIFTVMNEDLIVAHPEMDITDAGRVILRSGIQKLPVVDDAGHLVGIISNADVVRSQIERATPGKVNKLVQTLKTIHGVDMQQVRRTVDLDTLIPTQGKVYTDELEGRIYELENGLAEPLVVIDNGSRRLLLADGHHRVKAAQRVGVESMDAYVIELKEPVELGMAETARKDELESIDDITVVDYAHHPLIETTTRLQSNDE
ncbi:CBS domain-containing ParB/RepB/Spo0J family partition protein [Halocatena halophila]|uniref:CBS domain-containing ParB/RepB/Spo0J family partition protein n=1 Tax=Halocatena halophila TaxID=2814576 RepID=UPI002ED52D58